MTKEEIIEMSGIERVSYLESFNDDFHSLMQYYPVNKLYLDLERLKYDTYSKSLDDFL